MSKLKDIAPIKTTITNYKTNENYTMQSLDESFKVSKQDIEDITSVCNEELVYDFLFRKKLNGELYSNAGAFSFVNYGWNGWLGDKYYVFVIRNVSSNIVGAIDIKSNNLDEAEIGYWLSSWASGVMTNAILEICKLAKKSGYKSLVAYALPHNGKSQNAVLRAGFENKGEVKSPKGDYNFVRLLMNLV